MSSQIFGIKQMEQKSLLPDSCETAQHFEGSPGLEQQLATCCQIRTKSEIV